MNEQQQILADWRVSDEALEDMAIEPRWLAHGVKMSDTGRDVIAASRELIKLRAFVADLQERVGRAVVSLEEIRQTYLLEGPGQSTEPARLAAKIDGVQLVQGYIEEMLR